MYEDDKQNEYTGEYGRNKYSYEDDYLAFARKQKQEENYEDLEFEDVPRERKVRKKRHPFRVVLIVLLVVAAVILILMSPVCNIRKIEVKGNNYYSAKQIITMSNAKTGVNLFRSANASDIKERLKQDAYFEDVKVSRRLPGTLVITVKEREQKAAVVYGAQYVVIDGSGTVLRIADMDPKVTLVRGLTITKMDPGSKVEAEQEGRVDKILSLLKLVEEGNLYFREIKLSGTRVAAYINKNFVVKSTLSLLRTSIENENLQKVIAKLYKEKIRRGTITISENGYMSFSPNIQ